MKILTIIVQVVLGLVFLGSVIAFFSEEYSSTIKQLFRAK